MLSFFLFSGVLSFARLNWCRIYGRLKAIRVIAAGIACSSFTVSVVRKPVFIFASGCCVSSLRISRTMAVALIVHILLSVTGILVLMHPIRIVMYILAVVSILAVMIRSSSGPVRVVLACAVIIRSSVTALAVCICLIIAALCGIRLRIARLAACICLIVIIAALDDIRLRITRLAACICLIVAALYGTRLCITRLTACICLIIIIAALCGTGLRIIHLTARRLLNVCLVPDI